MNLSFSLSSTIKSALLNGDIDFGSDSFKGYLARDGYSYSSTKVLYLKNFLLEKEFSGDCWIDGTAKKIYVVTGNFTTEGFVVGNYITTNGTGNVGTYVIRSISTDGKEMRVDIVTGSMANLGADDDLRTVTVTTQDHADNAHGYTPATPPDISFVVGSGGELIVESPNLKAAGDFGTIYNTATNELYYPGFLIVKVRAQPEDGEVVAFAKFSTIRMSI